MKHLVATIPKSRFKTLKELEYVCSWCDGEVDVWLINTMHLPKQDLTDVVCFMVWDGRVRGYFHIIETDKSENWRNKHRLGKHRTTDCIVMATWRPVPNGREMKGFQGWRYTDLQPF